MIASSVRSRFNLLPPAHGWRSALLGAAVLVGLSLTTSQIVSAAPQTWDGNGGSGDANWANTLNWNPNATIANGDSLFFAGSFKLDNVNNAVTSVDGITFNAGAGLFRLGFAGGTGVTLTGDLTNNSTSQQHTYFPLTLSAGAHTVTVTSPGAGGQIWIRGGLGETGGAASLVKTGPGDLVLDSTTTYTGLTTVQNGVFYTWGANNRLPITNALTITGGVWYLGLNGVNTQTLATVSIQGGLIQSEGNGTLVNNTNPFDGRAGTVNVTLAGSVGLNKTTGGTLTLAPANNMNTYSGPTMINAGTLELAFSSTASVFNSAITVKPTTTLRLAPTNNVGVNAAATVDLNGELTYNATGNNYWVMNGAVTANSTSTINLTSGGITTAGLYLDGGLKGSADVTLTSNTNGLGLVLRTNNSTYSGTLTVNGTASAAAGTGRGLVVGGGGGGGSLVSMPNANITLNGTLELGNQTGGMGWTSFALSGSTFQMNALNGTTGVVVANFNVASTRTLSVGNNGGFGSFSGTIANGNLNTLSFIKNGNGTQTLSGANITYSGSTSVNSGKLVLSNTSALNTSIANVTTVEIDATSGDSWTLQTGKTLSGAGTWTKTGSGRATLLNTTLTTSGQFQIQEGTLRNGNNASNWTNSTADMDISTNAILDLFADPIYVNKLTGNGFVQNGFGNMTGFTGLSAFFEKFTVGVAGGSSTFTGVIRNNAGNTMPAASVGGGVMLEKVGIGTLELTGANLYTGGTVIANGTLALSGDNRLVTSGALFFGGGAATAPTTTVGALDLSTTPSSQTVGSLSVFTNSNSANTITIGSGKTLAVSNGNVTVGANIAGSPITKLTVSGAGAWTVGTGSNATFQVGGAADGNSNAATLDMNGLSTFTANLGSAGTFRVGDNANTSIGLISSTAILAATSTITAGTVSIGGDTGAGGTGQLSSIKLGSGTQIINADTIKVGSNAISARSNGDISFNTGTGTLKIRAANGTGAATLNLVNTDINGGNTYVATMDLAGHHADLLIGTLTMASRSAGVTAGGAHATLSFDTGTLAVSSLVMSKSGGTTTGTSTSILNIGGGIANIGSIAMAQVTSPTAPATATINLTGGTTTLGGNITRTGGVGTTTATINLDGGTLNMAAVAPASRTIGTAALPVVLNAKSGKLMNLAELNDGGTLTKTTAGTLTFDGVMGYSGETHVNDGTLIIIGNLSNTTGGSVFVNNGELHLNKDATKNAFTGDILFIGDGMGGSAVVRLLKSHQMEDDTGVTIFSDGLLDLNGESETIHGLSGAGGVVDGNDSGGETSSTLTVTSGDYQGTLQNSGLSTLTLVKAGGDNLTLAGENTHSGDTIMTGTGNLLLGHFDALKNSTLDTGAAAAPRTVRFAVGTTGVYNLGGLKGVDDLGLDGIGIEDNTISVGANGQSTTYDGAIIGSGGKLTKTGLGTLTLTGANTYTGDTNVNQGTLVQNGDYTGGGNFIVNSFGTLKGSGTANGGLIVNGGTVAPGTSIESLGGFSFFNYDGGTFEYEIDTDESNLAIAADLLYGSLGSTLTLLNDPVLDLIDLGSNSIVPLGTKFTLIAYNGLWDGGTFLGRADDSTFSFAGNTWLINYDDDMAGDNFPGDLTVQNAFVTITAVAVVVPEPSTYALGLLGLIALGFIAWRRTR